MRNINNREIPLNTFRLELDRLTLVFGVLLRKLTLRIFLIMAIYTAIVINRCSKLLEEKTKLIICVNPLTPDGTFLAQN
jgi:hypothetical protein